MFLMYSFLFLIMIYTLKRKQLLHANIDEVWEFASSPYNLKKITPEHMNFNILTDFNKMYEGQIIKYKVSPFPFFRVGWTTKITYVEEPFSFIDKQVSGPFNLWEHEHRFEKSGKNTIAYDIVKFKLPIGLLGRIFGSGLVKYQLNKIFEFRKTQLNKMFKK